MAAALANLLGLTLPARAAWGPAERNALAGAIRNIPAAEFLHRAKIQGVWAERCRRDAWDEAPPDGSILRQMRDSLYGEVVHCIGPLASFSRSTTIPVQRLAVTPGQDTMQILAELGIPDAQVAQWLQARIVV